MRNLGGSFDEDRDCLAGPLFKAGIMQNEYVEKERERDRERERQMLQYVVQSRRSTRELSNTLLMGHGPSEDRSSKLTKSHLLAAAALGNTRGVMHPNEKTQWNFVRTT